MRLLVAALLAASASFAEDCAQCVDGKICLTHEATDDIAIRETEVMMKTKDMMGKRSALKSLKAAQSKHMNLRSRKVTLALLKGLADPDVDVKQLAASIICEMGEPSVAVQGLSREISNYKKLVGSGKPKKASDILPWENNLKMLRSMYESLSTIKDPGATKPFVEDLQSSNQFIGLAAAEGTQGFKGNKEIYQALYDGMKKWLDPSQQTTREDGMVEAFFGMSKGLEAIVEKPPDGLSGKTQPQQMSLWNKWVSANLPQKK